MNTQLDRSQPPPEYNIQTNGKVFRLVYPGGDPSSVEWETQQSCLEQAWRLHDKKYANWVDCFPAGAPQPKEAA